MTIFDILLTEKEGIGGGSDSIEVTELNRIVYKGRRIGYITAAIIQGESRNSTRMVDQGIFLLRKSSPCEIRQFLG